MKQEVEIGTITRSLVVLLAFLTAAATVWACADEQMVYAAIGLMAQLIVVFPFLFLKKYDLFSPWSLVLLSFAVLSTPQAVCMSFKWPSVEAIEYWMLLGRTPEYFVYPGGIYLLGVACLTIGYFCFQGKLQKRLVVSRRFNQGNMIFVLGACVLLSIVATFAFIRNTGGVESGKISSKRTKISTLDVQTEQLRQYGALRLASKLSSFAFLTLLSYYLVRNEKLSLVHYAVVGLAFFAAFTLPFYSSSRAEVGWITLNSLGVIYYFRKPRFKSALVVIGALGVTIFLLMSHLRKSESAEASFSASFESMVLNRSGPGLSKTAHVINHVPEPLTYQYGKTILVWLIAPVPRRVFPAKPMVHSGPIIGTTIYGTKISGVPPGAIAELYWNFHLPGVICGMLLLGWFLQTAYSFLHNMDIDRSMLIPIYLFSIFPIGFYVLGNSVGSGIVMRMLEFSVTTVIVYFCTSPSQTSR